MPKVQPKKMSHETIFLVVVISLLSILVIYEIVFILFFKKVAVSKSTTSEKEVPISESEDILVQPLPLGYSEPSIRKFEQCTTPVFELENPENIPAAVAVEPENLLLKSEQLEFRKGKAPILVVTESTVSL